MNTGKVAGLPAVATGMASLKACGRTKKVVRHISVEVGGPNPAAGVKRFTTCAVVGSVDSANSLAEAR